MAQKAESPDNSYEIDGKIDFMTLTDAGPLLVGHGKGLMGIDPDHDQPVFDFRDYGRIEEDELDIIPLTPYVIVDRGNAEREGLRSIVSDFSSKTKKAVIDIISGKTLFASEESGWQLMAHARIFLPDNKLVVVGNRGVKEDNLLAAGIYDLETGEQEGFVNLDPKSDRQIRSRPESSGEPFLVGDKLYVPTTKNVICANITDGSILWTSDVKNINRMEVDPSGEEIYGFEERNGKNTRIHKFGTDGKQLWDRERKIRGIVSRFQILPKGIAVVSDLIPSEGGGFVGKVTKSMARAESDIAFLNAQDGSDLWEKAPKTKGYVQHFYVMEDGILFGIHEGGINKISFDGTPLFKKPLKTGEDIKTMATTPQGVIYITSTDVNIIDLQTGDPVWKKPFKYKKAELVTDTYDAQNNRYLISTGKELIAIDENTGDVATLTDIKLEKKEVPNNLEIRKDGVFLSSDQNVLMLDSGGSTLFHNHYKAPGKSAAGAILAGIGTVASAAASVAASASAQANRQVNFAGTNMATIGDYTGTGKAYLRASENFADVASASFQEMTKRFTATSATENDLFILTEVDGAAGLIKVSKDSGNIGKEIRLKDKKPEYLVDEFGGFLYYQADNRTLYAYDLNK